MPASITPVADGVSPMARRHPDDYNNNIITTVCTRHISIEILSIIIIILKSEIKLKFHKSNIYIYIVFEDNREGGGLFHSRFSAAVAIFAALTFFNVFMLININKEYNPI